jgi:thioredoxin-related protein
MRTQKKYLVLFFLISTVSVFAQQNTGTFKEAQKQAQETNKKILLVFAGSDWCAPCMKLEKNILHTSEFKALATDKFVMYKADFPMRKKNKLSKEKQDENGALAEKYKQNGIFPLVIVLNTNAKELGRMSYKKLSPKEYFNKLNSFN